MKSKGRNCKPVKFMEQLMSKTKAMDHVNIHGSWEL